MIPRLPTVASNGWNRVQIAFRGTHPVAERRAA